MPNPDPEGRLASLTLAAESDPRAAFDLGLRFMRGDGLRQNSWEAIRWMRDAGERGDLRAQMALGRLYLTGLEETGADYNEAQRWLSMAASRGDKESAELLKEAEAGRADEQAFQTRLRRWRSLYTHPYWYRIRYYGYWTPAYRYYRFY
ncbi:MAG: tetratricopeptide repeat protein [Paracoccaceae bacterium]